MNPKLRLLLGFILFINSISYSQTLSQYRPGRNERVYVTALKDTVHLEVYIPREAELAPERRFPVIYLFDLQNRINYLYNLQTIDYLSSFGNMPAAVLVGVDFPGAVRTRWTLPNTGNGKADSLLAFLFGSYRKQLEKSCKLSGFNVLIGHSRTAMFSSYALAAFPGQVNAVIASSNSFFDFDNPAQQVLFENYITEKKKQPGQPQFFYFSSGSKENGDPHDSSVTKLNNYMSAKEFPDNFHWQHYRENTPHITVPGMTTGRALNDLFSPCTKALQRCFAIVNKQVQTDSVPWSDYLGSYKEAAAYLGLDLRPDLSFYNSIASTYMNDYNSQFKEHRFYLASVVLQQGIAAYPAYPGFYSSLAGIKLEQGDKNAARKLIQQAQMKIKAMKYCNPELLKEEKASIDELLYLVK
jgi:predicted alpha/beta superfamily hydrolase